jgi:hypothetical protein
MTSDEEVERQIRKALMVRAARVHLRTDGPWVEPVATRVVAPSRPARRWRRRAWELAVLPAVAALIAAVVVLGAGPKPASLPVGGPSSAATTGLAIRGPTTPVRRAGGGVVLAGQGRWHQPTAAIDAARPCDLGVTSAMVHGLRSPNCLE